VEGSFDFLFECEFLQMEAGIILEPLDQMTEFFSFFVVISW
jgi:hypothetical protein